MSKVIPKEQLTAYQRWELADFEPEVSHSHHAAGHRGAPDPSLREEPLVLPTAEEVERLHQQAWQEGYQMGLEEGRKAGFESGKHAVEEQVQRLHDLAEALDTGRLLQDETIAREVLTLALTMAQQVVRHAIQVRPELILEGIKEALVSLPSLTGHHKIVTHPDHVGLVQDWLAQEHGHLSWKVSSDAQMEPGSFRFESTYSELDGNLRARWREITECLAIDAAWLN
jgi:flagellar assembly protein FliH